MLLGCEKIAQLVKPCKHMGLSLNPRTMLKNNNKVKQVSAMVLHVCNPSFVDTEMGFPGAPLPVSLNEPQASERLFLSQQKRRMGSVMYEEWGRPLAWICTPTHAPTHTGTHRQWKKNIYWAADTPPHPTGSCCSLFGVLGFLWVWVPKACSPAETGSSIFHFAIFSYLGVCEAFCLFCFILGQISLHYHTWQIFVFTVISVFLTNFNISKMFYSGHYFFLVMEIWVVTSL